MNKFTVEQMEHIAKCLYVEDTVTPEQRKDRTFNWLALAHNTWSKHLESQSDVYLDYVMKVRKVVRTIEAHGGEIRIIQ
jgi:hypothetical protein